MPSDIRPGMRVRVTRGEFAGAVGSVVKMMPSDSYAPWVSLDVGERLTIGVYVSALEPIAETPTLRDRVTAVLEAARAQRDREAFARQVFAELAETRGEEACCHEYAHAAYEEMVLALTQALEEGS